MVIAALFLGAAIVATVWDGGKRAPVPAIGPEEKAARVPSEDDIARKAERSRYWTSTPARDTAALVQPAPKGFPGPVAAAAIREAGHPCGSVDGAVRMPNDGSIIAVCTNGERYRVFTVKSVGVVAMKCSAAAAIGVEAC